MITNTTLCYIDDGTRYLMLHRTKKQGDMNKDKWIGIGGHMEEGESPEDCILREALEETGYRLTELRFRGIITFVYRDITEYMMLFTASGYEGEPKVCSEGDLQWVAKKDVPGLNLWEGDRYFLRLLSEEAPFFSLKLVYNDDDTLREAVLDGRPMPPFSEEDLL